LQLTSLIVQLLEDLANDLTDTLKRLDVFFRLVEVGIEVADGEAD
jgi:hypothetical protein